MAVVDLDHRNGLPCRAPDCDTFITMPTSCDDRTVFVRFCKDRIDHELTAHGYVHQQMATVRAKYDWAAARRMPFNWQKI